MRPSTSRYATRRHSLRRWRWHTWLWRLHRDRTCRDPVRSSRRMLVPSPWPSLSHPLRRGTLGSRWRRICILLDRLGCGTSPNPMERPVGRDENLFSRCVTIKCSDLPLCELCRMKWYRRGRTGGNICWIQMHMSLEREVRRSSLRPRYTLRTSTNLLREWH